MKLGTILKASLLLIVLTACEDLLLESPKDFISPGDFYKTLEDAEMALNGAYNASGFNDVKLNMNLLHADYCIPAGSFTSVGNYHQPLASDQHGRIADVWAMHYRTINRANEVLSKVAEMENLSANDQRRILAESYFLRAWSYWNLLKGWGEVPLRIESFSATSELGASRRPTSEVYEQIVSDLSIAENDAAETVGENTGRASRWAAKVLLAEVFLGMENWSGAAEKSNEVIESNYYSLVPVSESDDFSGVFYTTTSSEDIFSWHASNNRNNQGILRWLHGIGSPYNQGPTSGFTNLADANAPFIVNWDSDDLRKGFNIYDRYVNADGDTILNPSGQTRWRFKKYIADPVLGTYSIPLWRLPHAYLIYAEASVMSTGSPSELALERLNMVKRRGYGFDPNLPSPVDLPSGMSRDDFRAKVVEEAAYEFFLEGDQRWWNMKRTNTIFERFEARGKPLNPVRLLYPIPQQEIDTNPAIDQSDQNPGY